MKISDATIEVLASIIMGGSNKDDSAYRSEEQLASFFYNFGAGDMYSSGFPARKTYTMEKLKEYNGEDVMRDIIEDALHPSYFMDSAVSNNEVAEKLNNFLRKDGYKLTPKKIDCIYGDFLLFDVESIDNKTVEIPGFAQLDLQFINERIKKANDKLVKGDYGGAIANARSLVEAFQKEIIRQSGMEAPKYDGDLQELYKETQKALNLDLSRKDLSDTLKQIVSGVNSLISGIGGLSANMGEPYPGSYTPVRHHAKLAVNTAFALCEFLLESYEYQEDKGRQKMFGVK